MEAGTAVLEKIPVSTTEASKGFLGIQTGHLDKAFSGHLPDVSGAFGAATVKAALAVGLFAGLSIFVYKVLGKMIKGENPLSQARAA